MIRVRIPGIVIVLALAGCEPKATNTGPAGCWHEAQGLCQEWPAPAPEAEKSCRGSEGKWVMPTCLNLDAVATCTSSVKDSQIFYASGKFTAEQAKAECGARTGFTFAMGNARTVIGPKKP